MQHLQSDINSKPYSSKINKINQNKEKKEKITVDTKDSISSVVDSSAKIIKSYVNMVNSLLKNAFSENTKKDYRAGFKNLIDIKSTYLKEKCYPVLVKSLSSDGIDVVFAKNGTEEPIEFFVPKDKLLKKGDLENGDYSKGDVLNMFLSKSDGLCEVDDKIILLQKHKLLGKEISYQSPHAKKPMKGRILGPAEDSQKKQIIFQPEKGVQFAVDVDSFLQGVKKAQEFSN